MIHKRILTPEQKARKLQRARERRVENLDKERAYFRRYRRVNADRLKADRLRYAERNREHRRLYSREWQRKVAARKRADSARVRLESLASDYKMCRECKAIKPKSDFHSRKDHFDGLRNNCKQCQNMRTIRHYGRNKARHLAMCKRWREGNVARLTKYERARAKTKAYRERAARTYQRNRSHIVARLRQRRHADLNYRILSNLRARIGFCLRRKSSKKTNETVPLLGCSITDFRIYLESKFETGMSWENYGQGVGKWSIDHIMPCAIFDLTKPEHQNRCFHFSNQQPLWVTDNSAKHDKVLSNQFNLL